MAIGAYGGRTNRDYGRVTRGKHAGQRHVVRGTGVVGSNPKTGRRTRTGGWQSLSEDADGNQVYRSSGNRGGVSVPKGSGVPLPQSGGSVSSNLSGQQGPYVGGDIYRQDEIDRSFRAAQDAIYEQQQNYKNPQMMGYGPETPLDSALDPYWNAFRQSRGPDGSYPELPDSASLYDRFTQGMVPDYAGEQSYPLPDVQPWSSVGLGGDYQSWKDDVFAPGYVSTPFDNTFSDGGVPNWMAQEPASYTNPTPPPPLMPEAANPMYETAYPPSPEDSDLLADLSRVTEGMTPIDWGAFDQMPGLPHPTQPSGLMGNMFGY